jgi:hypothetical protein
MFRLSRHTSRCLSIVQRSSIRAPCTTSNSPIAPVSASRHFTATTKMPFPTPSMDPPKHEMAFFPNMTTSLPSESAEFRRVLWTGLYSQLVLMTVPVDGEIGDEVCQHCTQPETLDEAHLVQVFSSKSFSSPATSIDTHRRSNPHLHIGERQSNHSRQGPGRQGGRSYHRSSWHATSIYQHRADAAHPVHSIQPSGA